MPRGNRTGPMGMGPMTGRGGGYCADYPGPGFMNRMGGRGFGRYGGWGRGWGYRFRRFAAGPPRWAHAGYGPGPEWGPRPAFEPYAPSWSRDQEVEMLEQQVEWLKQQQEALAQRLEELSGEPDEE